MLHLFGLAQFCTENQSHVSFELLLPAIVWKPREINKQSQPRAANDHQVELPMIYWAHRLV